MHDLIIRGGTIADGSGQPTWTGDVAIDGSIVTAVGAVDGPARRVIEADGLLVTPGWVDIHTHYDGQATWDPEVSPSGWHGVTTVVMGNCGVGFAPARASDRGWLIQLMEGVEDIPGAALAEGMNWNWETFGEYLDEVERTERVLDVHAPFSIELIPNNVPDGTTLYFGMLDFATGTGLLPAAPGPVEAPATNGAATNGAPTNGAATNGRPTTGAKPAKVKTYKCIVWDLDNTMWDGILVEDGAANHSRTGAGERHLARHHLVENRSK